MILSDEMFMEKNITVKNPGKKPYLVTGHKFYMIGAQDGTFPEHGEHIPYEMWGMWAPPVKVINGFWLRLEEEWLMQPDTFIMLPYGCTFTYRNGPLLMERFQYVPQEVMGISIRLRIKNKSAGKICSLLHIGVESNLMPVWLSERLGIQDGKDQVYSQEADRVIWKDEVNPWWVGFQCSEALEAVETVSGPPEVRRENHNTRYREMSCTVTLMPEETRDIYLWFAASQDSAVETGTILDLFKASGQELLKEKQAYYKELKELAQVNWPSREDLTEMYRWNQYINDWIIQDAGKTGKGVVAGYPEFPWWFGNDTNYILPALLMQGMTEICKSTLRLLRDYSMKQNGNGKVVHEISTNGVVYYDGMTTETPQFADSVWLVYCYSGDYTFLTEMYDFCVKGIEWLESVSEDGLPKGYGISEIAGLDCFCCDTALLMIRGYEVLALMSAELEKTREAVVYQEKFENSLDTFKRIFYMPELGFYGDMAATKEEIIPRAETWKYTLKSFPIQEHEKIHTESSCKKDKSPESKKEKEKLRKRMELVLAEAEKMEPGSRKAFYLFGLGHSVAAAELGYIRGEEGRRILKAMDEWQQEESIQFDQLMPIALGRRAQACNRIGDAEGIIRAMEKTYEGFGAVMPGATSEIAPDKGCFVQAWNSLAIMWPYAGAIFGIKPNAKKKKIVLSPCINDTMDGICLKNVRIGKDGFTFHIRKSQSGISGDLIIGYEISVIRPSKEWDICLAEEADNNIRLVIEEIVK